MRPEDFGLTRHDNCRSVPIPVEPPESAVARMIAGLEMLLREEAEDES